MDAIRGWRAKNTFGAIYRELDIWIYIDAFGATSNFINSTRVSELSRVFELPAFDRRTGYADDSVKAGR